MERRSTHKDGWVSAVGRLSTEAEERFWHLWVEMARSQLARGSWTPSIGEVARLMWGFLIDASEFHQRVRTRFLQVQIDFAEQRLDALAARHEDADHPPSAEASLGTLQ